MMKVIFSFIVPWLSMRIAKYEHKAVKEGADDFWSYPDPDEIEVDSYCIDQFKEDHLLFNKFDGDEAKRLTFPFCTFPKIEKLFSFWHLFQKWRICYFSFLHFSKNEEFVTFPFCTFSKMKNLLLFLIVLSQK
jgi:hypothetical protein